MANPDPTRPTRTDIDAPIAREDAELSGPKSIEITERSFAGTSFAADQREQTEAHRGESREHLMDDTVSEPIDQERDLAPRDES